MELPNVHYTAGILPKAKGRTGGILVDDITDLTFAAGKSEGPTSFRLLRALAMGARSPAEERRSADGTAYQAYKEGFMETRHHVLAKGVIFPEGTSDPPLMPHLVLLPALAAYRCSVVRGPRTHPVGARPKGTCLKLAGFLLLFARE